MATATTASKPASTIVQTTDHEVAAKFRAIALELGGTFFERRAHIELFIITLLAKQHCLIFGPPGTGKSALIRALCARVVDAKYWEVLLDKQLSKNEVFGPWDIPLYDTTGKWARNITDSICDAHIAFTDEVGKSGPGIRNSQLTIMNERIGPGRIQVPLLSIFGASNEVLEPEDAAYFDRWMSRVFVGRLQEPANFMALLRSKIQVPGQSQGVANHTTVTLDELMDVIENVIPEIQVPDSVLESIYDLRVKLAAVNVEPSDRRMAESIRMVQASAFLNGRTVADEDDLSVYCNILWDTSEQIPVVEKIVMGQTSELNQLVAEMTQELEDMEHGIDSRHGQSTAKRASYGAEVQTKLADLEERLEKSLGQARRENRATARLEAAGQHLVGVKVKVFQECLNMKPEQARRAAGLAD